MAKAITKEVLRDQLSRREIAPVYVLYGTETYLRDLAAATISKLSFSDGEMRDFNEDEFDLSTADQLRRALAAAEQLPMMASRRVIRVTNVRVAAQSIGTLSKKMTRPFCVTILAGRRPQQCSFLLPTSSAVIARYRNYCLPKPWRLNSQS